MQAPIRHSRRAPSCFVRQSFALHPSLTLLLVAALAPRARIQGASDPVCISRLLLLCAQATTSRMEAAYISLGLAALLTAGLGVPLIQRKVPPNDWYGLRTEATKQSEYVWYEANVRAGRDLLWFGAVELAIITVGPFIVESSAAVVLAGACAAILGAITLTIRGKRHADRLLRAERREPLN
jgi:hypothetical protein